MIDAIDRKRGIKKASGDDVRLLVKQIGIEAAWKALTDKDDGKRRENLSKHA